MDPISYKKAKEAMELAKQLIDGIFDEGILKTEIQKRLLDIETLYTPRLSDAERKIDDNHQEVTAQMLAILEKIDGIKLNDLSLPYYIAHRAAKNIFPECSMEGYKGCVDLGFPFLEIDVHLSADGVLLVNHDTTMDRTTNKTGALSSYTAMGFKSAKIDILPGWEGTPVLFEDLIREFGNKVIYVVETKDRTSSEILSDMLVANNLNDNCIVCSFTTSDLEYPITMGLPTMFLTNNTNILPSAIISQGITHVGISSTVNDQYFVDCINSGLITHVYTVNRRYETDHYLNLGVHGIITDDPLWVSKASPILTSDPFNQQMYFHGMQSNGSGDRGAFISPNQWGYEDDAGGRDFVLQSWVGELPNEFSVTFDMKRNSATGGWGSIAFCTSKDIFSDNVSSSDDGYHLLYNQLGNLNLYKSVNGVGILLQSVDGVNWAEGETATIKIIVTNTSITCSRTDGSQGLTFSVSDSEYRKGFMHFGRNNTKILFSNVTIS